MTSYNYIYQTPHTPQEYQSLINTVISVLVSPDQPSIVAQKYANDKNLATEVQAYAKLSGSSWTFYVKTLNIIIGRNTENVLSHNNNAIDRDPNAVDIDLGPGKVVSRKHAAIIFNTEKGGWELHVSGRNGAKVNFDRVHTGPGQEAVKLASGAILDIGGTQMMFILPDTDPIISDSTFEALMPRLVSLLGPNGQTNNQLLTQIIKNSIYFKTQHEQIMEMQRNQRAEANSAQANQARTFKMYGNSSNLPYPNGTQFIHQNIPSGNFNQAGNVFMPNGLAGANIMSHDFKIHSKNSSSASGSSTSSRFQNPLSVNGFPHAIDFASDLSRDENKTVKPPHSYATMITQAILSSEEGVISLADIYKFIAANYAYYRCAKTGWQNSIRHNLSLNRAFEKVPRKPNEPGKGMKWRIAEAFQRDFIEKWNNGNLSKIKRGSSVIRQLQLHMSKYNSLPIQRFPGQNSGTGASQSKEPSPVNATSAIPPQDNIQSEPYSNNSGSAIPPINDNMGNMNSNPPQFNMQPPMNFGAGNNKMQPETNHMQPSQDIQYQNVYQNNNFKNFGNPPKNGNTNTVGMLDSSNESTQPMGNINFNPNNNALVSFNNASYGSSSGPSSISTSRTNGTASTSLSTNELDKDVKGDTADTHGMVLPNIRTSLYQTTSQQNSHSPISASNGPTLSAGAPNGGNGYDTILRSPSKSFHITAMEAYTPERGSTVQTKSPKHEADNGQSMKPETDSLSIKNLNPRFTPSTTKSQNHVKSSPGVLNLLQFSSVNNTPKLDPNNGKGGASNNKGDAAGEIDNDIDSVKDIVSSPIKRIDSGAMVKGNGLNKDLLLDTDNAKVTIVNE